MVCAIVRAYYSLSNINDLSIALGWASREILVASIVVCAPSFKPLLSRARAAISGNSNSGSESWKRYGDLTDGGRSRHTNTGHQAEGGYLTSVTASGHRFSGENGRGGRFKMTSLSRSKNGTETLTSFKGESQERINETTKAESPHSSSEDMRNGIQVTTHVSLAVD